MMESTPRFINGIYPFEGQGLAVSVPLDDGLSYTVPADRRAQLVYLRAGNSADGLITLTLLRDGVPMRLFPVGAKGAMHVPLAVLEDLFPETKVEVLVSAERGVAGHVVLDIGLMEI
ncbi:hypothetical protein [Muricoccus pecuniae]|uniref:Molybdopterin oxidoreductase n=1 Tax=Muricoccus pecuniae TaxID=693023 RepID=A0A840YBP2_9PROT|nr:hypothetical protein [Roseomonas pecuniae]MBB5696129.1 hypothetical protein [Roseomonas pecuniae]